MEPFIILFYLLAKLNGVTFTELSEKEIVQANVQPEAIVTYSCEARKYRNSQLREKNSIFWIKIKKYN